MTEELQTVNYIRNRIIHRSTDDVLFRHWFGRKTSLKHLKRFGNIAHVLIPQHKRNKFQTHMLKGVIVGYSYSTEGYRIWISETNKIIEPFEYEDDDCSLTIEVKPEIQQEKANKN